MFITHSLSASVKECQQQAWTSQCCRRVIYEVSLALRENVFVHQGQVYIYYFAVIKDSSPELHAAGYRPEHQNLRLHIHIYVYKHIPEAIKPGTHKKFFFFSLNPAA